MDCEKDILSEDTYDFLVTVTLVDYEPFSFCRQRVSALYDSLYVRSENAYGSGLISGYYDIPKLYGLLATDNLTASGILQVRAQPALQLDGSGVLMGFVDTGIDYAGEVFRRADGSSRVIAIWDQAVPGEEEDRTPEGFSYGTLYTEQILREAMRREDPYSLVPSRDENGHGTYVASVAAGNELEDGSFSGAAPAVDIAMVKLKPAKSNLREYYQIKEGAVAFQENDIMAGVSWLARLAASRRQALVICIALGTNSGAHSGMLPLARTLNALGNSLGVVIAVGTGNETARAHHYEGMLGGRNDYEDVEIRVGEGENGFQLELWAQSPETYSVAIRSPEGEAVPRIYVRPSRTETLSFLLSGTQVQVAYRVSVVETGDFLALIRFINVTPGVWTIRVYNDLYITGTYNMWLPMEQFIQPDTVFLRPREYMTLTSPSDAQSVISAAAYNHRNDSLYLNSGRGYTADGKIRPDLAAPGVDIDGYIGTRGADPGQMRAVRRSGSSASAAHLAGAAALLCQWAAKSGRYFLNSSDARAYFIRGAQRKSFLTYPNREWGFGSLDVYGIFEQLQYQGWE